MISDKTLRQWRKSAIKESLLIEGSEQIVIFELIRQNDLFKQMILKLTQELMDINLTRKEN